MEHFRQILNRLPPSIGQELEGLPGSVLCSLEEIRLRCGQQVRLETGKGTQRIPHIVTAEELQETLNRLMRFSYYAYENDLAKGFVTIEGGHRVGVCGKVVQKNGEAALIKEISSLNIRFAKEIKGCSDAVFHRLYQKDGQVQKADTKTLLEKAFSFCDSGDVRLFLKDDKYICMDSGLSCFVIADGMQYAVKAYSYNGEKMVEMANEELQGSDFYEVGHSMTEYVDQLNTMGFSKTAAAVYDRDVLRVCAADSGITFLSKILLHHSYLEEDKTWAYDPYAYMEFVEGEEAEDAYVLPESNEKELSADELRDLGEDRLRIARNEIYARYGRSFQDEALAQYFQKKAWYCQSETIDDTVLSETELANRDLILQAEQNAALEDRMLPEQYQPAYEKQDTETEKNMEDLLNTTAYNGFLSRTYQNVKDAELGEIFYNGAGISGSAGALQEELKAEYLKVSGQAEIYTDFMALSEQEMEVLLQNETGLAMADFNHRIGWYYLPAYGAFAKEVSDTNFKQIEVQDVYYNKAADVYSVLYRTQGIMDENGEEGLYRVTLKRAGDHWQIMANTEI